MPQEMRVADYIARFLADQGCRDVFFLPGGGAMHLNDGLACESRLVKIHCHHEQACGIAAEAWGRAKGTFGVAMVTTGPGATNIITPVTGAWIDSIPMMVISGQVKRSDLINGRPLRQCGVQEVEIIPMVRGITKYAVTIDNPNLIRYHLERALFEMRSGRPGPVWLDIPLDVQASHIIPEDLQPFEPPATSEESPSIDTGLMDNMLSLLRQSRRPLFLAGHGVRLSGAANGFLRLAELLNIPVTTTWNALDILPYDHPLCVGRPGVVALRAPNFAIQNCDLLISIGCRLENIVTAYNPGDFARNATKVIVDVDSNEIDKLDMEISLRITADAGLFIENFQDRIRKVRFVPQWKDWNERCIDWKKRYSIECEPFMTSGAEISHYRFVSALSDLIPENTPIATGSSGLAIEVFYSIFRNKPGQRIFLTAGLGAMGYGVPAAIGVCLANNRCPTIAVESDGSLQLNIQELATIRGNNLPICLLVMNNRGYASIRNTQRHYFNGQFIGTGPEAGVWMPDLRKVAHAYGLEFMCIEHSNDLGNQLSQALTLSRPSLVDIRLKSDESLLPKVTATVREDGGMMSMPLEDMSPLLSLDILNAEMEGKLHLHSMSSIRKAL
ncbi:thiamine pyrophosphate-binding protein [Desulfatirhabdium butyrativorans]|uniref:thiamine pyrophosphate-binding protein n=1 Tax=Desulfatirhabdium butyrativorans TaxID=340467 RepID=UPI000412113A|nr:thiamine pyrophosphate-binding protein [Desulfatirhabdium butyrativorans]